MIINGVYLLASKAIKQMLRTKVKEHGVSHGLSEVGYDIRIKQEVRFVPPDIKEVIYWMNPEHQKDVSGRFVRNELEKAFKGYTVVKDPITGVETTKLGRTALASSVEEFELPSNLWGELRNKSTHARRFFDTTIGTDMEPGWKGFLTIEIIFHGDEEIIIPAGSGIAKAVFHEIKDHATYTGKYNQQPDHPVPAIKED